MKRLFTILAFLLLCPMAEAANYYVSKAGLDAHACSTTDSAATNRLTIHVALLCLSAGDTLTIHAGTYAESILSTRIPSGTDETHRTIVEGAVGETVIIRPPSPGNDRLDAVSFGLNRSYITLKNVTVDGSNTTITVSFVSNSHHIRVEGCIIKNSPANVSVGMRDEGASDDKHHMELVNNIIGPNGNTDFHHCVYFRSRDNLIDGNEIFGAKGYGVRFDIPASGIRASNQIVRNNRIHGNGSRGVNIGGGDNIQVYNNLIYSNNTQPDSVGGILISNGNPTNAKVYNNTIYSNKGYGIWILNGTGHIIRNNITWANTSGTILNQTSGNALSNNLTTDPLFVDTTDFRLGAGSNAIDAGVCLESAFTTDFSGNTRSSSNCAVINQGLAWDIGAQERLNAAGDTFTINSPNGGTIGAAGSAGVITWGSTGTAANVRIRYDNDGIGFGSPTVLSASTPNSGSFNYTLPAAGTTYRFEICDAADNTPCDYSDADVTITASAGGSVTKVISENMSGSHIGDINGVEDNSLDKSNATTNHASVTVLGAYKYSAGSHSHPLIRFPTGSITPSAAVSSCSLCFYVQGGSGATAQTLDIRKLLRTTWGLTTANWNTYDGTNSWTTAGALGAATDRVDTALGQITGVDLTAQYRCLTQSGSGGLFDFVQAMITAGTATNIHVERNGAGEDSTYRDLTSSNGTDGQRPYLEVTYTIGSPEITATQPNTTGHYFPGDLMPIRWQSQGISGDLKGELSLNAGVNYLPIPIIGRVAYNSSDAVVAVSDQWACECCVVQMTSLTDSAVSSRTPCFKIGSLTSSRRP